ncbi:MAG: extracellular solute-binding protein [Gammaproteobacteria bacterium]|nr:MAG: extracellular solute-binding protein [Gammaproteobacteria bacterium]
MALLTWLLAACGQDTAAPTADVTVLQVWAHAGQATERETLQQQVERFNRQQADVQVQLTFIPERSYNAQVQAAAIAGDLPDVLEFDGPFLYNYVWQGHLIPLETLLATDLQLDLLQSIRAQGTWHNHFYGIGSFDSGLGMFARRSLLMQAGMKDLPLHPKDAWSVVQFNALLNTLTTRDPDGAILDLKFNYPDEWFTYAFSPLIQSAGGDLINREDYQSAREILNSPAAVFAMQNLQNWINKGWVDLNVDDAAFTTGRVALSWAGHWEYQRYQEAWGDDLVLLPLPDFGKGSRTGQGSWVWGITRYCEQPRTAADFLEYLLQPGQVLAMANANGAVPATATAIKQSALYREGGPLHLFVVQLNEGYAVPRPQTPAYPVISNAFRRAFADIRSRDDVRAALDRAVQVIDQDIRDNRGYPFTAIQD